MKSQNAVELADWVSRRRAVGTGAVALIVLVLQVVIHPVFRSDGWAASGWRFYAWPFNDFLLLLLLLPAAGMIWGRRVRELVNDDIAREHARRAAAAGFWIAMIGALGLYALPVSGGLSAREAIYVVVMPASGIAVLVFAWLESRAHRGE
jgi:hypothetical protein